jgi:serine/threonine-protein kinase
LGYLAFLCFDWTQALLHQTTSPGVVHNCVAALAIVFGFIVYLQCRSCRLPPVSFANLAVAFEIVAALGIVGAGWGWEHHGDSLVRSIGDALGIGATRLETDFVEKIAQRNIALLSFEGVHWVGVWILVFPFAVPLSPKRTLLAAFLTASTVPIVAIASVLVNGTPASTRPWIPSYLIDMVVPTYIVATIAFFGSRMVYKLTRALSKARQLGSYHLVERLGAGGMGEVWKAEHRMLARPAAIKLIRSEALGAGSDVDSNTVLKRFEREAQATAAMRSAHTIDIYDFGVSDDGAFYYVMELLEGLDIESLIQRFGPVTPERAVHLLLQVCDSLAEAHENGLIHRDIKPANVYVSRYGRQVDFVKVLDFGLVKWKRESDGADVTLTRENTAGGTPAFMAPEQVLGNRPVDARTDIYAVGCLGYWLLTGQLVFEGKTPMETLMQHVQAQPVPPSDRTELEIPGALEEVILSCLEKEPDKRPQNADILAAMLENCMVDEPWTPERSRSWWDAHLPRLAPQVGA